MLEIESKTQGAELISIKKTEKNIYIKEEKTGKDMHQYYFRL